MPSHTFTVETIDYRAYEVINNMIENGNGAGAVRLNNQMIQAVTRSDADKANATVRAFNKDLQAALDFPAQTNEIAMVAESRIDAVKTYRARVTGSTLNAALLALNIGLRFQRDGSLPTPRYSF